MEVNISKKIELVANIAILVVACLLGIVLVKNYLLTKPSELIETTINDSAGSKRQPSIKIGQQLTIADIKFPTRGQTLILAISSTCHFCTESAPFYKKLAQMKGAARLIVLMPQAVEDGRKYLDKMGVSVDEVRQLPLDRIGVQGTPTLILLDSSGVVRDLWTGFLPPEAQLAVLKAVKAT
jgi:thioredoxin-related protein